jgi:hypothetical protein
LIYFLWHPHREEIKIGFTNDLYARIKQLNLQHHCKFAVRLVIPGMQRDEGRLHRRFQYLNVNDAPGREFFFPAPELLDFIDNHRLRTVAPESFVETSTLPTGVNDNATIDLIEPTFTQVSDKPPEIIRSIPYEPVVALRQAVTAREKLSAVEMFLCPLPGLLGTAHGARFCDIGLKLVRSTQAVRSWLYDHEPSSEFLFHLRAAQVRAILRERAGGPPLTDLEKEQLRRAKRPLHFIASEHIVMGKDLSRAHWALTNAQALLYNARPRNTEAATRIGRIIRTLMALRSSLDTLAIKETGLSPAVYFGKFSEEESVR